jgi:hypothetical protein
VIKTIEIEGFKSLEKVRLELGGLNLFIGANASGKSNFFDALRVLQGIGYGFTVDEIFNGKPQGAGRVVWQGIRGGIARVAFLRRGASSVAVMKFKVQIDSPNRPNLLYDAEIAPREGIFHSETVQSGADRILNRSLYDVNKYDPDRSAFSVFQWADSKTRGLSETGRLANALVDAQWLDPNPLTLRQYAQAQSAKRLGESGEDFAAIVAGLLENDDRRSSYLSWLRQLTPLEFDEALVLKGALGEPLFALREGEEILPAPILSDGTLRFAAITAAFFQPDMPAIITLEEIENGIHPSRLRLLIELLKSQTRGTDLQVFATTHSPVVLAWLDEEDYKTTFLCRRDAESGASIITPLSEIPHLIELVRKQPIGELFTEGWLEGAF